MHKLIMLSFIFAGFVSPALGSLKEKIQTDQTSPQKISKIRVPGLGEIKKNRGDWPPSPISSEKKEKKLLPKDTLKNINCLIQDKES